MKITNWILIGLSSLFVISGCSTTKLESSWADPLNKKSYDNIMVIGITQSMMNRRAYESNFVASLQQAGMKPI